MKETELYWQVFNQAIADYHKTDDVDAPMANPYEPTDIRHLMYRKHSIDTAQWHLEDIIRDPQIDPVKALAIKRRIDKSNQDRTDMVEFIDSYFLDKYKDVKVNPDARINTESPAWALDRPSILALNTHHMGIEAARKDAEQAHVAACAKKLAVLNEQHADLSTAIQQLIEDIEAGWKYMKVYKQMKMYNDPALNPVLYASKK